MALEEVPPVPLQVPKKRRKLYRLSEKANPFQKYAYALKAFQIASEENEEEEHPPEK